MKPNKKQKKLDYVYTLSTSVGLDKDDFTMNFEMHISKAVVQKIEEIANEYGKTAEQLLSEWLSAEFIKIIENGRNEVELLKGDQK